MDRRKFIVSSVLASGAVAAPALLKFGNKEEIVTPQQRTTFNADVELDLESIQGETQIFPGDPTRVWRYRGYLIKGMPENLSEIPGSYLGPIIKVKKGQRIRINYLNKLNQESIIHWHGLHIPAIMDGHPRYVIGNNERYIYEFPIKNRAGTYWFHPHPHGKTGPQVANGLAGLFLVSDNEEEALNLPSGEFDIPLVIQDRQFDRQNQLVYPKERMSRMEGYLGDIIMINGVPDFKLNVSSRAYRLRLLNGSNSRIYKLSWSNGMPLTVIGTDGGLLESPINKNYVTLGPAERIDLIADFSGMNKGRKIDLLSMSFPNPNVGGGMMMGRRGMSSTPNGAPLRLMTVKIVKEENVPFHLPEQLSKVSFLDKNQAINQYDPRRFLFSMSHMSWTINGKTFQLTDVDSNEKVKLNTTEVWEFVNGNSQRMGMMGNMMQMAHPIHIHGLQFQIIERTMVSDSSLWESLGDGFVDNGWKDSFLLLPNMKVKILIRFEDYPGLFLYHCHNLEHEDMGMMRNYLIT